MIKQDRNVDVYASLMVNTLFGAHPSRGVHYQKVVAVVCGRDFDFEVFKRIIRNGSA